MAAVQNSRVRLGGLVFGDDRARRFVCCLQDLAVEMI